MGDTMSASLTDATDAEEVSVATFDELVAAKTKEIDALIASIEDSVEFVTQGTYSVMSAPAFVGPLFQLPDR